MEIVSRTVTSILGVESTLVPDSQYGQYSYLTGFYNPSFKSEEFQDVHLVENSEEPVFLKSTVRTGTDRYGFHLDGNDDSQRDLTKKRKCEYRLFFFGGSTAAGRYLANIDDTIPAKLEDLLQKNFNSQGIDIQVINTGSGGFFSVQEVALFQRIRFALKIDYANFLTVLMILHMTGIIPIPCMT